MEDSGFGSTVEFGGFDQLIGDAGDGLAEQEDAERAYHAGQQEGRVGVLQTPVGEHLVLRDDGYGPWDHHGAHDDAEEQVTATEAHFGKHVAEHGTGINRNAGFQTRYDQRVDEQAQEIEFFLDTHIVGKCGWLGEQPSGHLDDLAVRCK